MSDRSICRGWCVSVGTCLLVLLAISTPVLAQEGAEEPAKPWSNEGELAFVNTSGNSSASTLAFRNRFAYNWTYSEFRFVVDFHKATSRRQFLFNEGGGVRQELVTETSAERYELAAEFRQNFVGDIFWYVMGSWYRSQPAGIDSRSNGNGGVGYRFLESDVTTLVGEFGIGVTREQQVQGEAMTFADLRGAFEWKQKVTETTDFELGSEALWSAANTDDLRIKAMAAATVRVSSKLALRVSYDLRFDNDPATVIVDIVPDEPPAPFTLNTTDRSIGASLVLKF